LLCEAKRLVAKEFDENLALHGDDLMERLSLFAKVSNQPRLANIHEKVALGQIAIKSSTPSKKRVETASPPIQMDKTKVGDVIDGKVCSGFYRGQPVFN